MLDNTWKFNEARLISTVTAKPRQPMQPNGKKLQICWHVENACALKFDSFYSQQKHTQPCSQVAENNTFSYIWKDIWKSKLCIEIYSKTVPSHAVKCQEISLCWNMCKHRCFVRKCMAKQRPAMQPSGRKQQIVQHARKFIKTQCSTLKFTGKQRPDIQPSGGKQKMF